MSNSPVVVYRDEARQREQFIAACLRPMPPRPADAVVVLCGEDQEARCEVALAVFARGYAKTIAVTGGVSRPPFVQDAAVARSFLISKGVRLANIAYDGDSQNTWEQAEWIVRHFNSKTYTGTATAIVIASEYHLPRAILTCIRALDDWNNQHKVRLIPLPTNQPWTSRVDGHLETRGELLTKDLDKAANYYEHTVSFARGLEYLADWESHDAKAA